MLRYLIALLCFFSVAEAAPPVIWGPSDAVQTLTGKGVLVGQRLQDDGNYVLNPSAYINTDNVSVSNATVTRGTTTPLSDERVGEFIATITSANGTVTWSLNAFSEGLKGMLCEARFRYRNAASNTVFQVLQGASVVAAIDVTADATNARLGVIPFNCGDLSAATTFRMTRPTVSVATDTEVAAVYVGRALGGRIYNFTQTSLTGSGTITGIVGGINKVLVAGASSSVTLSTTPFGTTDPIDGTEVTLIGNSNTNTVQITYSDTANGLVGNGNIELNKGSSLTAIYDATLDRWIEKNRIIIAIN